MAMTYDLIITEPIYLEQGFWIVPGTPVTAAPDQPAPPALPNLRNHITVRIHAPVFAAPKAGSDTMQRKTLKCCAWIDKAVLKEMQP